MATIEMMRATRRLVLAALLLLGPIAAAGEDTAEPEKNLVELARETGEFNMFLRILAETDLLDELKGEGSFTVFAPTDKAFDHLDMDLIDSLLHPSQKHYRTRLVGHHIVGEVLRLADHLGEGEQEIETLAGTRLKYLFEHNLFYIETAAIEEGDLEATNGILHGIDRILVPRY